MNPEDTQYPMVAELTRPHNPNTLHGAMALSALHVQKLIEEAGPEYYERVTWHPAYMEARTNMLKVAEQNDVKALQAACKELWALVNQLIDGTYATSELAGGGA